jgi:hypothetical protein
LITKPTKFCKKLSPVSTFAFQIQTKIMWKSQVGTKNGGGSSSSAKVVIPAMGNGDDDDDWETDPDFVNEMSEEQQRWGGARDTGAIE